MSHRRIKRNREQHRQQANTAFGAEVSALCNKLKSLPVRERLRYALPVISDEFLRATNQQDRPHGITGLMITLAISTTDDYVDEAEILTLTNNLAYSLCIEELRRRDLARIKGGFPDSLLDECPVSYPMAPASEEEHLSVRARALLREARQITASRSATQSPTL